MVCFMSYVTTAMTWNPNPTWFVSWTQSMLYPHPVAKYGTDVRNGNSMLATTAVTNLGLSTKAFPIRPYAASQIAARHSVLHFTHTDLPNQPPIQTHRSLRSFGYS